MEINTQQMEALLHIQEQQAQVSRKSGAQTDGFESLLSSQLTGNIGQVPGYQNPALNGAALYSQIMLNGAEEAQNQDADTAVLQAAFEQASGALDLWDNYTRTLGRSSTSSSLRDAYSLLEGIDAQVAELKASPAASNPAFDDIVNELAILSATEKFKFNRGDYL